MRPRPRSASWLSPDPAGRLLHERLRRQDQGLARRSQRPVRSVQLQEALSAFVEQAAAVLHADVLAGQEVPFELEAHSARMRGTALYCYRPLTGVFIAERMPALRRLDAYDPAARLLDCHDALDRYLLARGKDVTSGVERGKDMSRGARGNGLPVGGLRPADAALLALLEDVFDEQTDFDCAADERSERLRRALERLDGAALPGPSEVTLVATLHGLAISSPELRLTRGLLIAQPDALQGAPEQALLAGWGSGSVPRMGYRSSRGSGADHLLVVHTADCSSAGEGVAEGAEVIRDLLRALRLFGDGRIALGARAYARAGDGPWTTIALGAGGRPHGMLLVTADQEDELRAFCNLISRRAPHGDRIAWALRRFELGCDRPSEYEALSDYLLALRALLGQPSELEPEGALDGLLASRLAALCAIPERRPGLTQRTLAAIALERQAIAGAAVERAGSLAVVRDLADHLRAVLRDVICGHLDSDLAGLADELLLSGDPLQALAGDMAEHAGEGALEGDTAEQLALSEEQLRDDGQAAEILRVAV